MIRYRIHLVYFTPKFLFFPLYRGQFSSWGKNFRLLYTGVHFTLSTLYRLFYKDLTRKRPGLKFLSALARCPLSSMSTLDRFYCILIKPWKLWISCLPTLQQWSRDRNLEPIVSKIASKIIQENFDNTYKKSCSLLSPFFSKFFFDEGGWSPDAINR